MTDTWSLDADVPGLEQRDEPCVVLLGDPGYYARFGFEPSGSLGIMYRPVGAHDPHSLVRRLARYDPIIRGDCRCRQRKILRAPHLS